MSRLHRFAAVAAATGLLLAVAASRAEVPMQVASSAIVGGHIAQVHACRGKGGADQPPPLSIRGIPAGANYVSIVADDPDAVKPAGKVWVHWNVFNVPASGQRDLAAGEPLAGDVGRTSGGARGYEGMCPPDGVHTYRFAVFATREKLKVDASHPWTIDRFEAKFGAEVLAKALVTGKF